MIGSAVASIPRELGLSGAKPVSRCCRLTPTEAQAASSTPIQPHQQLRRVGLLTPPHHQRPQSHRRARGQPELPRSRRSPGLLWPSQHQFPALAIRRHVPALDGRRHARSRTTVPQNHRLHRPREARPHRRTRPRNPTPFDAHSHTPPGGRYTRHHQLTITGPSPPSSTTNGTTSVQDNFAASPMRQPTAGSSSAPVDWQPSLLAHARRSGAARATRDVLRLLHRLVIRSAQ